MLIVDTIVSCKDDSSSGKSDRSIFETCAGSASAINTRNFRPCRPAYVATFGNVAFMAVPLYTQTIRHQKLCANFGLCKFCFERDWRGQSSGLLLEGCPYCRALKERVKDVMRTRNQIYEDEDFLRMSATAPAINPPDIIIPSHTSPAASTSAPGAPNGASRAISAASRTPIPPCVSGNTAASFASGHAKSHTRSGSVSPQEIASNAVSTRKVNWISVPVSQPEIRIAGRLFTARNACRNFTMRRRTFQGLRATATR